jgi:hypothetical protein
MARLGVFLTVLGLMLLSGSCGHRNGHQAARNTDRRFCAINEGKTEAQHKWDKELAYAISSGNYTSLRQARMNYAQTIADAIREVNEIPDTLDVQYLKAAELALLEFEKMNISQSLQPFEKMKANTPMKELSVLVDKLRQSGMQEKLLTEKVNVARDKFCERNEIHFSTQALEKRVSGKTDTSQ